MINSTNYNFKNFSKNLLNYNRKEYIAFLEADRKYKLEKILSSKVCFQESLGLTKKNLNNININTKLNSLGSLKDKNLTKAFKYFYKKKLIKELNNNYNSNVSLEKKLQKHKPKIIISNLSVDEGFLFQSMEKKII